MKKQTLFIILGIFNFQILCMEQKYLEPAKKMIKVKTNDNTEFEISLNNAKKSETFANIIEDLGEDTKEPITLPMINSTIFGYIKKILENPQPLTIVSDQTLKQLIPIIEYLHIQPNTTFFTTDAILDWDTKTKQKPILNPKGEIEIFTDMSFAEKYRYYTALNTEKKYTKEELIPEINYLDIPAGTIFKISPNKKYIFRESSSGLTKVWKYNGYFLDLIDVQLHKVLFDEKSGRYLKSTSKKPIYPEPMYSNPYEEIRDTENGLREVTELAESQAGILVRPEDRIRFVQSIIDLKFTQNF